MPPSFGFRMYTDYSPTERQQSATRIEVLQAVPRASRQRRSDCEDYRAAKEAVSLAGDPSEDGSAGVTGAPARGQPTRGQGITVRPLQ